MNFRINFLKLIDMLLPPMLRQTRQREWLSILTKPMKVIHEEFITVVEKAKKEVAYQASTGLVEERLNEEFGVAGKIWINNLNRGRPAIYIGEHNTDNYRINIGEHNQPQYLFYISEHNEYDPDGYDFKIVIDNAFELTLNDDKIAVIAVLVIRYSANKSFVIRNNSGTNIRYSYL